ncbi:MAG: RNB domain-containing ribonuclease, partial [Gammaproteobacteria bacterium]
MAKRRTTNDPYREREAQKYQQPIPSREYILECFAARGAPASFAQIAEELQLSGEQDLTALRRRLRAMERDAQIIVNRHGDYGLTRKMDLIAGRVVGHTDGFGFLVPDDGGDDLFLSPKQMRSLLHGDRILGSVIGIDRRGRREGAVVEVLERANQRIVGRFHMEHGVSFVIPSNTRINQDIAIPPEHRGGASINQIVEVEIIEQPNPRSQPIGRVSAVLGDHMAPGMEIDIAIRSHDLPYEWPDAVERDIALLTAEVPEAAKSGREDIRELPLVTIDGEDARDFDDAVYCEPQGKGWRLIVAIADVSSYVQPDTALESEARLRGTSVYFPGRVIPMLPEVLSNGLCSINPKVDRLCLGCELSISAAGHVREYRFFEGVMRSWARLTYTEVAAAVVAR